jgi:putative ABC transport system permease protein
MKQVKIYVRLLQEGFSFAVNALVVNKLRTFLSLLGITIGIFAIISVFTLVDSMEQSVRGSFAKLGDDTIFLEKMPWGPEPEDKEYAWWKYIQRPNITQDEAEALKKRLNTADQVTFFSGARRTVEYGSASVENATAIAVSEGFENFITVDIAYGRLFTLSELEGNARVCVLGNDVATRLFGNEIGTGRSIKVGGFKCKVIGVLKKEGQSLLGNGADEWAIIPVGFSQSIINVDVGNTQVALRPKAGVSVKAMEDEAVMTLRNVRRLRINQDKNFAVNKTSMLSSSLDDLFSFLSLAGLIIGGFSILVGGFSIANIMFVSVRERTGIIGIQKALGAKRSFILFQFLFESIILCLIGGVIGLLIIWVLSFVASGATGFTLQLTLKNVAIGLGFSVGIGLIAGIVPASVASKMMPVDAMRSTG